MGASNLSNSSIPLNHPELMSSSTAGQVSCVTVRTGSEQLNHPELMRNYPVILVPSRAQWFKQVRKSWTTPNSWEIIKFLTCSNYSSTQETRTVVELDMSSWQCVTSCAHTHLKLAAHSTAAHSKQRIIAFQNQYHVTSVQGFEEVW